MYHDYIDLVLQRYRHLHIQSINRLLNVISNNLFLDFIKCIAIVNGCWTNFEWMLNWVNTKLLVFISIPIFLLCIILALKKYIYLCRTLSAHQRDETGGKRFFISLWSKNVLSLIFKIATFIAERWYDRYSTWTDVFNIFVKDVLYINDWRGCLLISLSCEGCS